MMRRILIGILVLVSSCATAPVEPTISYEPPLESTYAAVFYGEDSPGKFLGKGHEKIFVCRVDGLDVKSADFDNPVTVSPSLHTISICYREGLNTAEAQFEAVIRPNTEYQIRLGEHSWTGVNLWIENKATQEKFLGPATVPKVAGETTILIFN